MEINTKILGREHQYTLMSMANLASTYRDKGRRKEAEELGKQVMETQKNVLGQKHPDTLMTMHNFAYTLRSQGRDKEAIILMVQVERLRNEILGSDHPYTLVSTQTLHEWQMPSAAVETVSTSVLSRILAFFRRSNIL